jgi:hypothetical protein
MSEPATTGSGGNEPSYALHRAYLIAHRPANMGPDLAAADLDFLAGEGLLLTDEEFETAAPRERDRYLPE